MGQLRWRRFAEAAPSAGCTKGLHSLDFPGLYQSRWAWYPLIIGLSLGGVALSLTSLVIGWRVLRAKVWPFAQPARVSVRQSA